MTYSLTPLQRAQLLTLATAWRVIAQPVGPMHSWWDYIFDVEAMLLGGTPMRGESVEWYIDYGRLELIKGKYWNESALNEYLSNRPPIDLVSDLSYALREEYRAQKYFLKKSTQST